MLLDPTLNPSEPAPAGQTPSPDSASEVVTLRSGSTPAYPQPHSSPTPATGPPVDVAVKGELTYLSSAARRARKTRSDSKLKNLADEKQEQIIEWLERGTSFAQVVRLIHEHFHITISVWRLRHFHSWWHLQRHLADLPVLARELTNSPFFKTADGPDNVAQAMGLILQIRALQKDDAGEFARLRRLQQTDRRIELRRRKFEIEHPRPRTPEEEAELQRIVEEKVFGGL